MDSIGRILQSPNVAEYGSGIRLADYCSGISVPACVLVVLVMVLVLLVVDLVVVVEVASH